jgi:hypothetical protein
MVNDGQFLICWPNSTDVGLKGLELNFESNDAKLRHRTFDLRCLSEKQSRKADPVINHPIDVIYSTSKGYLGLCIFNPEGEERTNLISVELIDESGLKLKDMTFQTLINVTRPNIYVKNNLRVIRMDWSPNVLDDMLMYEEGKRWLEYSRRGVGRRIEVPINESVTWARAVKSRFLVLHTNKTLLNGSNYHCLLRL